MEKRNSQLKHEQPMKPTRGLFCTCDSCVARCQSQQANKRIAQASELAVDQICVNHEAMNGCSLKDCFENVNIAIY